jgi:hypothetical protein
MSLVSDDVGMSELPPLDVLVSTRNSLHQVAEHVLAAARKTWTGQIGLRPTPGGFSTPDSAGRVVAVVGTDIVVIDADGVRRAPITTVRAGAELVGIAPGFPWTKHAPATPLEPDTVLTVDPAAARVLADWFALGDDALSRLRELAAGDQPTEAQIFPEHFDLGMTAAEVNYGASPGDEAIPLPYVYVGPYAGPPARDDFWNADFGAYRTIEDIATAESAQAFFVQGRDRLRS